ncbi:MAG: sensor histidine kinase [Planctomycetota bacterium]
MTELLIVAFALLLAAAAMWLRTRAQRDLYRKRLQASESALAECRADGNRLAAGLAGATGGLIVCDVQGHVMALNATARELTGCGDSDTRGRRLEEVVPWPRLHEALLLCRRNGVSQSFEMEEEETSGRTFAIRVKALPDGGAVIGMEDQSRLKRLESLRRDFVTNVSHELKTPLAAIQGFVETLLDDPDMLAATRHRFLERVAVQTDRLATLVADLLRLSRLDEASGMLRAEPCDLTTVLRETVRDLLPIAEKREIDLQMELSEGARWVRADRESLRQITGNLIDNALKYTPERGTVTVQLRPADGAGRDAGAKLRLEVADTGIGMGPDDQERIFERFYRVDEGRSRDVGGTGLGLSIVKNTAINLGGSIGVKSELGVGSMFWVEFPEELPPT